jgi:hypothetical protein
MDTQTPQPGMTGWESSRTTGIPADTSDHGIQQEWQHPLVHCDAANAATKHMTQDAHLKIVRKTGSSMNMKQHAVGSEYMYSVLNGRQITV